MQQSTGHSEASDAELTHLRARVQELEANVADYEALLEELPDLFERKFQQRLEPLLERYRLLAQAQDLHSPQAPLQKAALRWSWPRVRRISFNNQDSEQNAA